MIDLLDEGGVFFLKARPTTHCIYHAAGMEEDSPGEGTFINHEVWSSSQGKCALLLAWPSSSQMLDIVSFLRCSVSLVLHVDSLRGFLLASCTKFFCSFGRGGLSCGGLSPF